MAPFYIFLVLIIQSSLALAESEELGEIVPRDLLKEIPDDDVVKDGFKMDFLDSLFISPQSYSSLMADVFSSEKPSEAQIEEMKQLAKQNAVFLERKLVELLSSIDFEGAQRNKKDKSDEGKSSEDLSDSNKSGEELINEEDASEKKDRKRRSVETPLDSSRLVMRLLNHIKATNECQNVAIEKMMTAQEIADKFGIEFTPEPEVLSYLASSASEYAKDMAKLFEEAENATKTHVEFVPIEPEEKVNKTSKPENSYYHYSAVTPVETPKESPNHHHHHSDHIHYSEPHSHYYYGYPYETQITSPPVQQSYVTPKPSYYDTIYSYAPEYYTPAPEYYPQYSYHPEPTTTTTTIILPMENTVEPEPELVGEEYEEVVSSKVFIDDSEAGATTVNHVTTYTVTEKAHFRNPQIEKLPQQMQYYFFL